MKAVTWQGTRKLSVETVPDPEIVQQSDVVVKVSATAICGSDLHLYDHYIASMQKGDILGHEFMGEVVDVGRDVKKLKVGDRVVVPFPIACGHCLNCENHLPWVGENPTPNPWMGGDLGGYSPAGIFGYSHMLGG